MSYKITTTGGAAVTVSDTFNNAGPLVFVEVEVENTITELDLTLTEAEMLAETIFKVLTDAEASALEKRLARLEAVLEVAADE